MYKNLIFLIIFNTLLITIKGLIDWFLVNNGKHNPLSSPSGGESMVRVEDLPETDYMISQILF